MNKSYTFNLSVAKRLMMNKLNKIQRYDVEIGFDSAGPYLDIFESKHGDIVYYEDIEDIVNNLDMPFLLEDENEPTKKTT